MKALGWVFHAVSVTFYLGTLAWCGVVGHERIIGGTRCRRCFERCDVHCRNCAPPEPRWDR